MTLAHCHLGLGRLHRRTGETRTAQEHLTTAVAMFDDMGMDAWRERAEVEWAQLVRNASATA